jgi:DNA invertase Pin-like site-specific DNA recombinase
MAYAHGYVSEAAITAHEDSRQSEQDGEAQRREIWEYFKAHLEPKGVRWGRHNEDGTPWFFTDKAVSALRKPFFERSEARQAAYALGPGDYLIVAKSDRAFRDPRDCSNTVGALKALGVYVVTLDLLGMDTSTPRGEYIYSVLVASNEWRSAMTSARNKEIAAEMISQNRRAGGPNGKPHGYHIQLEPPPPGSRKAIQRLVPDWEERRIMEWTVRVRYIEGGDLVNDERAAKELRRLISAGQFKATREWNPNKVRRSRDAMIRICSREGYDWIQDDAVRQFIKKGLETRRLKII